MGLCKCPKRKVTSLFCREHNVNVCEHCMADSHKQCVIKSFSDWLSDSDAESNCLLCNHPLREAECVRLQCLDIYHAACLAEFGFSYPAHTAPAGYRCPTCKDGIIPEQHISSITAQKLREFLATVNWARPALGLAPGPEYERKALVHMEHATPTAVYEVPSVAKQNHVHLDLGAASAQFGMDPRSVAQNSVSSNRVQPPPTMPDASITARRKQELDMEPLLGRNEDENKYERRTNIRGSAMRCSGKRKLIYIVGGLFVLVFLLILMHSNKDNDPLLNPQMDPNMAQVAPEV